MTKPEFDNISFKFETERRKFLRKFKISKRDIGKGWDTLRQYKEPLPLYLCPFGELIVAYAIASTEDKIFFDRKRETNLDDPSAGEGGFIWLPKEYLNNCDAMTSFYFTKKEALQGYAVRKQGRLVSIASQMKHLEEVKKREEKILEQATRRYQNEAE